MTEEFFIDGKKVQVYDDVMPSLTLEKWFRFYKSQAAFSYNKIDSNNSDDTYFLQCQLNFKKSSEIFDIHSWLPDLLKNYNPECTFKHYHASYINLILSNDQFTAHEDIKIIPKDKFYVGCIWFGNPYEPANNCGFQFQDRTVEYKFNRMILFDGSLWHKPLSPVDDYVRLSYYISFTNAYDYKVNADTADKQNPWYRKIQNNRNKT